LIHMIYDDAMDENKKHLWLQTSYPLFVGTES
jgi:hypothetical protein